MKTSDTSAANKPIATSGSASSSGILLDLVRANLPDRSLDLLAWDGKKARISKKFAFGMQTYVPVSLPASTLEAIRFPSLPIRCKSSQELFRRILDAMLKYSGYPLRDLRAVPYFVLASWVPEFLPMPPTLVITSPSSAEARLFLRLLRCFCRRAVVVIDISGLTRPLQSLLRASSGRGAYVARRGEFADTRCAKGVYSTESDVDTTVKEGLMRVAALPVPGRSVFLDDREEDKIAGEFQSLLLDYRLRNYRTVRGSTFDAPGFTTAVRELAQTLGAAVVGNPELQRGVVSLLTRQDDDERIRQTTLPEFGITALLSLLHERESPSYW